MKKLWISAISTLLFAAPIQAKTLTGGAELDASPVQQESLVSNTAMNAFSMGVQRRTTDIPELNVVPRTKSLPEVEMHPVVIDWYPWHCQLGRAISRNWRFIYDRMGRFPVSGETGELMLTVTPDGISSAELVKSSGNPQLDQFEIYLYESASKGLIYPDRTHRTTFKYPITFQAQGGFTGLMQYHEVTPMHDIEIYYE